MRVMFFGSASSAARALLTASVSGSERYSTPSVTGIALTGRRLACLERGPRGDHCGDDQHHRERRRF